MAKEPLPETFRHLVTIERIASEPQNSMGETEPNWQTLATASASVEPISGSEYFAAAQTNASVTHRIRMRYISGLTPKMRIVWGDRTFEITLVRNLGEQNRFMEILAFEEA
jgi:SPP1 family predicted phage head-tail adaptor